jgi:AcrR family transcriptional regulator
MPKVGMGPVRRMQVFRAAAEVIAREAFGGTTIKKVADVAGVSTGTVNYYFANKRAMLVETLSHIHAEWSQDVRRAVEQSAPGDPRIRALVDAAGPTTTLNRQRWRVWTAAWSEALHSPELRAVLWRSYQHWLQLLSEMFEVINEDLGGSAVDVAKVARVYDALQNGLYLQILISDGRLVEEIGVTLTNYLRDSLGPVGQISPVHRQERELTSAVRSSGRQQAQTSGSS